MTIHTPIIGEFGPARILFRDAAQRIPPELQVEFDLLMLFERPPAMLGDWERRLEDRLGVTDAHRAFVVGGEAALRAHIRGDAAPERPTKVELPPGERGRSADDIRRLDRLRAKLARTDLRKEAREKAEAELAGLLAAPTENADKTWRRKASTETMALAKARGEAAEELSTGAVRVNSRDPLMSLLRANKLTAAQYDAGVECRNCYDARSEDAGSQMGSLTARRSAHDNDRFVHARLQRAKKLQRLGTIERAVALECRDEPAALQMLRAVCGEGKSVSHYGEGRAFARHLAALILALDVVSTVIGGPKKQA